MLLGLSRSSSMYELIGADPTILRTDPVESTQAHPLEPSTGGKIKLFCFNANALFVCVFCVSR